MSFHSISPSVLAEKLEKSEDCVLLDVRSPAEYQGVHVKGAVNLPITSLKPAEVKSLVDSGKKKIYIVCESGGRSRRACETLVAAGVEVINVEGGTAACVTAGLPVVRGKGVISLERQVRIVAGSLVVVGVVLGVFVDQAFLGISAFVGSGLVFAGVSNTCGMALMLAHMPWNQVKKTV
jgi:rhodanese-related sulfurtransferase